VRNPRLSPALLFVAAFGIVAALAPASRPSEGPEPAAGAVSLHAVLDSVRIACGVPGLGAAVIVRGRIVAVGVAGLRMAGGRDSLRLDDPFHIGSCTKSVTALAIASLVEAGRLRWSLTIGEAFPELRSAMRHEYLQVRLDQLLTHRGGVPPYEELDDDTLHALNAVSPDPVAARRAFVARVLREPAVHDSGAVYTYSNAGYTVAAAMAERATRRSWEALLQETVFTPLGLSSAGVGWPADRGHPDRPRGHRCDSTGVVRPVALDDRYRLGPILAPGGDVHLSVPDLARWAGIHLDALADRATQPVLADSTWRRLHEDPDGARNGYAMGWQVIAVSDSEQALFHDGTAGTFYTRMVLFPKRDRAVVIATNVGPDCGKRACERAMGPIMAAVRRALGSTP
jgi:CubicO group peptidase (beta-lactamase class C family)